MSKVVLITGATSGMGKSTALLLAKLGYQVYAGTRTQRSRYQLENDANVQDCSLNTVILDVCDTTQIQSVISEIIHNEGKIDILINNAGFGLVSSIEDGTDAEFTKQFDVNVFGVFRMCRAVLPHMREKQSGIIVNVSSFLGRMGLPFLGHYNASKYAVEGITDSLRYEVAPFGIRVHSVLPGLFKTNFVNKGLMVNHQTVSDLSPYQEIASHFVPMVAKKINEGPSPAAVGEVIQKIIENESAPISTWVGEEPETFIPLIKEMSPEAFEQKIKETFSL